MKLKLLLSTEGEQVADLYAAFPETIPAFFRKKLGITSENQCFDAVVMGRKTYEVGLKNASIAACNLKESHVPIEQAIRRALENTDAEAASSTAS